jgi:hypothetical protein
MTVRDRILGRLNLHEQESKESPPANLQTVTTLTQYLRQYANDLLKHVQTNDIRQARLTSIEIQSAINEIKKQLDELAQQAGLPTLEI